MYYASDPVDNCSSYSASYDLNYSHTHILCQRIHFSASGFKNCDSIKNDGIDSG